jgi:hypothetical protein
VVVLVDSPKLSAWLDGYMTVLFGTTRTTPATTEERHSTIRPALTPEQIEADYWADHHEQLLDALLEAMQARERVSRPARPRYTKEGRGWAAKARYTGVGTKEHTEATKWWHEMSSEALYDKVTKIHRQPRNKGHEGRPTEWRKAREQKQELVSNWLELVA